MGNAKRFEDLECWKTARKLCKIVYELKGDEPFNRDFKFVSQIRSSCGSGMDNIAEGFERGGNKELLQFLYIAKGSLGETRSQIYRAYDVNYITKEVLEIILDLAEKASSQLQNLISSINRNGLKGYKYI